MNKLSSYIIFFVLLLLALPWGAVGQDSTKSKNTFSAFVNLSTGAGKTWIFMQKYNRPMEFWFSPTSIHPISIDIGGKYKRISVAFNSKLTYRYGVSFDLIKPVEVFYEYCVHFGYDVIDRKIHITPFIYGGSFRNKYSLWGNGGGIWDNKYGPVGRALLLGAGMQATFNQHGRIYYGCKLSYEYMGLKRTEFEYVVVYPNQFMPSYPEITYQYHSINFSLLVGLNFIKK